MIQVLWEYIVKEETVGQFELAYGPGGAWSRLFSKASGFRGVTLLRDTDNPRRFLSIDLWDTEEQRQRALADHESAYNQLDASFDEWTELENELGVFTVLSEAAIRPQTRRGEGRSGRSLR